MIRFSRGAVHLAVGVVVSLVFADLDAGAQGRRGGQGNANSADPLAALHFRALGPEGNRVASIIGEPGNPAVVYIGAADGGIWKTTDAGTNWSPVFDGEN